MAENEEAESGTVVRPLAEEEQHCAILTKKMEQARLRNALPRSFAGELGRSGERRRGELEQQSAQRG
jgi:hypothetical protein